MMRITKYDASGRKVNSVVAPDNKALALTQEAIRRDAAAGTEGTYVVTPVRDNRNELLRRLAVSR